ncbi:MAG: HTH domain-containing protein [Nanoarchaeota archaeon]|nr:HTH domain-containing protein [Nanoarchaeota archaeon]MBU4241673.1 HTH domain-containing protein [Nanoarchaeota archaeon]MBU4352147.1 HTH domain-containing protein [Nanoarchaeota archaeon]MBU4456137.1 HTH domain-containing protein [Nanoarchaeota archaeon]MCG2719137.1 HTH domain-containing protein [Nanoarchaeota archaeon]
MSGIIKYGKPFTYTELAEELNVSQSTIRNQIYELINRNSDFPLRKQIIGNNDYLR